MYSLAKDFGSELKAEKSIHARMTSHQVLARERRDSTESKNVTTFTQSTETANPPLKQNLILYAVACLAAVHGARRRCVRGAHLCMDPARVR